MFFFLRAQPTRAAKGHRKVQSSTSVACSPLKLATPAPFPSLVEEPNSVQGASTPPLPPAVLTPLPWRNAPWLSEPLPPPSHTQTDTRTHALPFLQLTMVSVSYRLLQSMLPAIITTLLLLGWQAEAHEYALDGSGTTNPSRFFWQVMSRLEARAKPAVLLTYRAVGSSTGIHEFIGADQSYVAYNDFGSGDVPISADDYTDLTSTQGIDILHVPFSLGAMSFFHSVLGAVGGLNMTACVLADIFKRDITTWDDPEIMALNPNLDVPANQDIIVFRRVFGSSTTAGITTYLNAACPEKWGPELVGTTIEWHEDTRGVQGELVCFYCLCHS